MNKRGPRTGKPLQVWLPDDMKEQLARLAERNMRKMSAEVVIALQKHLAESGHVYEQTPATKRTKK